MSLGQKPGVLIGLKKFGGLMPGQLSRAFGLIAVAGCSFQTAPDNLGLLASGLDSSAWGSSSDGSVIVGSGRDSGGVTRALTFAGGVATDIGGLPASTFTEALGCSANGNVIVGNSTVAGAQTATIWTAGVPAALAPILTATASRATYCDAAGNVVSGMNTLAGVNHAVQWTAGVPTDLGAFGGANTVAFGMSADGTTAVGATAGGTTLALRWINAGAATSLPSLSGGSRRALKCSADGTIAVGDSDNQAVYWDGANAVHALGFMAGGNRSIATGVSDDGTIIVGWGNDGSANNWPLLWRNGVMSVLPLGVVTGAELITNGGFVGGASGWTLGSDAAYGSNDVVVTYAGGAPTIDQGGIATVANSIYQVDFTISAEAPAGNGAQFYFANNSFGTPNFSADGAHTFVFLASFTGNDTITFDDWNYNIGDTWRLTDISMRAMTATVRPGIGLNAQNISPDGETVLGVGNYFSGSHPLGALSWSCT